MMFRRVGLIVKSKCLFKASKRMSFGTYYDSQSGLFMPIPGKGKIVLNDVTMKSSLIKQIYNRKDAECESEIATTISKLVNEIKSKVHSMSLVTLPVDRASIGKVLTWHNEQNKTESVEIDCFDLMSTSGNETADLSGIESWMSNNQNNNQPAVHVNLYIDVSTLLGELRSSTPTASNSPAAIPAIPLPSVMSVVAAVARLCDAGASVLNIVLCSTVPQKQVLKHITPSAVDEIVCFTREVLEECIGLDVVGPAVMDRLSLQGAPREVVEIAANLGVKRHCVVNEQALSAFEKTFASSTATDDDHKHFEISVQVDGRYLHCLTSEVNDVLAVVARSDSQ